jgi:hypothetical protein
MAGIHQDVAPAAGRTGRNKRLRCSGRGHPACAPDDTRDLNGDGRIDYDDKHLLDAMCTFEGCARKGGTVDD